ncbi:hypothetical protein Hore_19820 [Halothermothrix orenii H 168]|uniref:Uncharacterized protein n=1 Tax=Halothermothrix orenii (strain H 168 / OCM 544 / DSM 9562) TaxID=373903 RepID=B8CZL0_HALOH|nr:hypothetical protein Hore_19820 [Halothermothrix orenii H 168]
MVQTGLSIHAPAEDYFYGGSYKRSSMLNPVFLCRIKVEVEVHGPLVSLNPGETSYFCEQWGLLKWNKDKPIPEVVINQRCCITKTF